MEDEMRDGLDRWADPPLLVRQVASVAQQRLRANYGWAGA
jgi:hypothetical protein